MRKHAEVGDAVTTLEWGIIVEEDYGPDMVLPPFAQDRERVERMAAGMRERSEKPETIHVAVRSIEVSAWTVTD